MAFKNRKTRTFFLLAWLAVLLTGITSLFWQNEYQYNLPTPVPSNYDTVKVGEEINLHNRLEAATDKPLFLHFYNPTCPCSRFNIPHINTLVKKYEDKVSFAIVLMSKDTDYTVEDIQDKFDLKIPVLFDKSIAPACGVYSTPQAVIINTDHKLYYRGNYNKSRYCTDVKSNFAEMALDSLLNHTSNPHFSSLALTSYGCTLPDCKK